MRVSNIASLCTFIFFGAFIVFTVQSFLFRSNLPSTVISEGQSDSNRRTVKQKSKLGSINTKRKNSIFFLKTHKCASSTIQNILLRYGRENNLMFVLPSTTNYLGHPRRFTSLLIPQNLQTEDNKYDIFAHHSRYNSNEVKKIMKPGAVFITILRDPGTLFESLYNFFHMDRRFNVTFEEFKIDPSLYANMLDKRKGSRYGKNQMCFDLGLNEAFFFQEEVLQKFIDQIEREFHLVMISEYMEVSLVLLADLLGWPLEQVVFLEAMVRQDKRKVQVSEWEKEKLRALNHADTILYKHFLEVFKRKIKHYGVERMERQVDKLITLNSDFYQKCVDEKNTGGYGLTYSYVVKSGASSQCYFAAKPELAFTDQLRREQIYRLERLRNLQNLMETRSNQTDIPDVPNVGT